MGFPEAMLSIYSASSDLSLFHGQKTVYKSSFVDKSDFGYKLGFVYKSGFVDKSDEKWQIGKMKDFRLKVTNRVSENITCF